MRGGFMKKTILFLCFLFVMSLTAEEIQIPVIDDMYTDCVVGGGAHLQTDLFVNCESAPAEEQIMLNFDFSALNGLPVESAILHLHRYFACGAGGGTTVSTLYIITEPWTEETWDEHTFVQYQSENAIAFTFSGPTGAQDTWYEIDMTEMVNFWMLVNQPCYGLVIVADTGYPHSKFNSKEAVNTDFHPYLMVTRETGTEPDLPKPVISLSNYPNPFNPTTTITFSIEPNELYELVIFNLKGKKSALSPITESPIHPSTKLFGMVRTQRVKNVLPERIFIKLIQVGRNWQRARCFF